MILPDEQARLDRLRGQIKAHRRQARAEIAPMVTEVAVIMNRVKQRRFQEKRKGCGNSAK
jgi:hypothetical protein